MIDYRGLNYRRANIHAPVSKQFGEVDKQTKKRELVRKTDVLYKNVLPITYQNNFSEYGNYKGYHQGQFQYCTKDSIKSDPLYEYEEGRRTILTDVAQKYGVEVAGFILPNSAVKKVGNNKTPALNIAGYNY